MDTYRLKDGDFVQLVEDNPFSFRCDCVFRVNFPNQRTIYLKGKTCKDEAHKQGEIYVLVSRTRSLESFYKPWFKGRKSRMSTIYNNE